EPVSRGDNRVITLAPDSAYRTSEWYGFTVITQPWWLATPRNGDLFSVPVALESEEEHEQGGWIRVNLRTDQGNSLWDMAAPIVSHFVDPVRGDVQRPLVVAPGISITLDQATEMVR